ncbi:MAG: glycoside hydrolase family 78 protein [Chloroflexi bacterium]|nr:glycoside hydrolase family 78 protein [Chloroflexota bacterium]
MGQFNRRAEWIWRPRGLTGVGFSTSSPRLSEEANRFVYFRRVVEVADAIQSAQVHVSADGRYQLFVNGQRLGRGPARCTPAWQYVDPYDLAPYLHAGRNVIAVLAHSYGRNTSWYELPSWDHARAFGCGGFFLQGDLMTASETVRLDTGDSWRCLTSEAWQRDAPSGSLGFMEYYDARRAPDGWTHVDFDDTPWERAEILRVPGRNYAGDVVPFSALVPRDIPYLFERMHAPQAVLTCAEVVNAPDSNLAEQLTRETLQPLSRCRSSTPGVATAEIVTTDECSVCLVLDFGEVVAGYIHFDLDGPAGAVVDFTYGERLEPDGRVLMMGGIPGFDVPPVHRYILREGSQSWERFEWNGLRYLQVTFRQCLRPLRVRAIAINATGYPLQARGKFECSDELLNRLWQAGAKTLSLCMHDGYEDCPTREQRQWMDAYLESQINYAAFGDSHLIAKLLRQIAQSQRPDGLTMMAAPGDFSVASFTNIPDFCLYWILAIGAYVRYTDDTAVVDELYPSVLKAIRWFEHHLNHEDLLTDVPHWVFIDWAELDKKGQVTALNAQFVAALRAAAELARLQDDERDAARFDALAQRIADAINTRLWDEARGVYADARRDGVLSRRISQQSNAAVIAYEVAPRARWPRMFETILDERRLVLTPTGSSDPSPIAFDEEFNVVLAQPFYSHFLHRALSKAGMHREMLANIRKHWSAMLADGDSTFWEMWKKESIWSTCHAWSSTPTFDLSSEILGVTPLAPGFRRFRIAPQPVDLDWARGAFPTPHGDIQVEWQRTGERFELKVDVPPGTEAEILSPVSRDRIVEKAGSHNLIWSE